MNEVTECVKKYPLTIGLLAKATNVDIETIRYYQMQVLIIEPQKPLTALDTTQQTI